MKLATCMSNFLSCVTAEDGIAQSLELMGKTPFTRADVDLSSSGLIYNISTLMGPQWRQWAENIAESARRNHIELVVAHSSDSVFEKGARRDETTAMIKRQIEVCGFLGIPQIVVHSVWKPGCTWRELRAANKDFYGSLIDTAEKQGVGILLENGCYQHSSRGMPFFVSSDMLLTTIGDLGDLPYINICWDTGHAHMQGADQYREIIELGNRLKGLHIADNNGNLDEHMAPFYGTCDFDAVMRGLLDVHYDGYFNLEVFAIPSSFFRKRMKGNEKLTDTEKLVYLPTEIIIKGVNLLFDISKHMLMQYGCYEE